MDELAFLEKLEGRCLLELAPALAVYKGRLAGGLVTVGFGAADGDGETGNRAFLEVADVCVDGYEATEVERVGVVC